MNRIENLSTSYDYVCNNSRDVKINYDKVDELIHNLKDTHMSYWMESNPFGINDMDTKDIINFLLIYHTIGDYCFWGDPKWEIKTDKGLMDGSFAIMYIALNRFKDNNNFNMSFEEFSDFLKGNVEIPLLKNRYENLVKMNEFLKRYNRPFNEIISGMNNDTELFEFIINSLDYYEDISYYNRHKILFYKRAQLLTSDILHVKEMKDHEIVDYSHLIGCADYKIPQVMRCYGMIEFSDRLASIVDSKTPLKEGSLEEIEIRANTLKVIDYISKKLNYSRMDINDFIWLLGQDKSKMTKPYHRTLTSHY